MLANFFDPEAELEQYLRALEKEHREKTAEFQGQLNDIKNKLDDTKNKLDDTKNKLDDNKNKLENGIKNFIIRCCERNMSKDDIVTELMEVFSLSREDSEKQMRICKQ